MKKLLAVLLAAVMVFGLVACGATEETTAAADAETTAAETEATEATEADIAADSDLAYVQGKGTLVVGITDFEPMDYKEEGSDEWIGFDADLAKAFAESIGVTAEFIEIDWDSKTMELDNKNIDVVWNGMTLTDGVKEAMECANAYANNAQIIVVNKDIADTITSAEAAKDLAFAVEGGSAGEEAAVANGYNYTAVQTQADAVMEVAAGTAQACIIDSLMAAAMVGEGTSYPDLTYTFGLTEELYGAGFRKGSDLAETLNAYLVAAYADGTMQKIAETYGIQASLIEQK